MRNGPGPSDFAVPAAGLVLVLLFSIPPLYFAIQYAIAGKRNPDHSSKLYEDSDGTATPESQKAFSDFVPRTTLLVTSTLGCVVSAVFLATSYVGILCFVTGNRYSCQQRYDYTWIEQCFVLVSWTFLLLQACIIFRTRASTDRFRLGLFGGLAALLFAVSLPIEAYMWISKRRFFAASGAHVALIFTEFFLALVMALTFLSLPRRPDLYQDGKLVDRQFTVTALSRLTFGWATPILAMTAKKRKFGHDDLPVISSDVRAQNLRSSFFKVGKKDKAWKTIVSAHINVFLYQWTMQIIQSFASFLPQLTLFITLKTLEGRDRGEDNRLQLWLLVIALGASDAVYTWIESWYFYVSYIKLSAAIYEQISAVVFHKAVRRKDVKGVSKGLIAVEAENGAIAINEGAGSKGEDTIQDPEGEDEVAKTKQSTINLIGVDGKRIADFSIYNGMILGSLVKLTIAIVVLIGLIGFIPLIAGFSAFALIAPLNYVIAKKYHATQDNLMKARDQKMAVVAEALQGIRQIKFSALEGDWYEKILKTRKKELASQWMCFMYDTVLISLWIFGPVCLSVISLTVYALIYKGLSPSIAFTTIAIFESIELSLGVVPELITDMFDCLVSCDRIQKYLESSDRTDELKVGDNVVFQDATVSWPSDSDADGKEDESFRLKNLNLAFPTGELSVISGKTGSGKSLLLSSIIGEADIVEGDIYVPRAVSSSQRFDHKATKANWILKDAIAYVAQIPWIENATIKDNILFSLPFEQERYDRVIHASALEKDLEMLEDGDMTDIGANGINLSGGQKWRVSFARALYSRAGILVLDDIFSAVDAHVGKHLFEEALTGELGQGRTRILVTHHVALCLPKTIYSVALDNGTVFQAGMTEELRRNGLIKDILALDVAEQEEDKQTKTDQGSTIDNGGSLQKTLSGRSAALRRDSTASTSQPTLTRTLSVISEHIVAQEPPKKFTEEEAREVGAVKAAVYKAYIHASGGFSFWSFIIVVFVFWSAAFIGKPYWVSIWSRDLSTPSKAISVALFQQPAYHLRALKDEFRLVQVDHSIYWYVGIYLAISLGQWFVGSLKYFFVYVASIRASKKLFEDLTDNILRTPLRFLDTTPVGRILNRFTSDFNMVDSRISYNLMFLMHSGISALAVIVASVFISPWMLLFAAILLSVCLWFAIRYLSGAREVKRLESNAKSPVFEQFGSVLQGIGTIRAFGKADEYIERMERKINLHCQAYYHLWLFNRWMGLRVAWVGAVFLTAMAALVAGIPNIDAALAGFVLSFSLQLSECIIWMLREYANVELDLNAVERIVEYSKVPTETQAGHDAPAAWPTKGELEVNDLVVSYAPDLPPVLKGLTFNVKQHERVGVVGRTGAGKSSLTLALFRFLEPRSGSVWIDGIDISKIKLFDLRSRLAIIPQDPVLFSGTIRSNLDPFNEHTDVELRDALTRVHLISSSSALPSGAVTPSNAATSSASSTLGSSTANVNVFGSLSSKISEGGLNLSQGQRQLLCLARAIVSRPKILVLDEATSSVDMETDALIQRSIREEFADSTLIVIAHRLSTIVDFDRILVLGEGKVVEHDKPELLLEKKNGAFREMVESSGERRELEAVIRKRQQG